MDWFFNGLGTEIIVIVITLAIGLSGGSIIYIHNRNKKNKISQIQKAAVNAKQNQKLIFDANDSEDFKNDIEKNILCQKQRAKNNATQTQIGRIYHE